MDTADNERIIAELIPETTKGGAFFTEVVCTFFFILIILMVKDPLTAPSDEGWYNCWTVGVTLISCITLAGYSTGAALNPVVGMSVNFYMGWQF